MAWETWLVPNLLEGVPWIVVGLLLIAFGAARPVLWLAGCCLFFFGVQTHALWLGIQIEDLRLGRPFFYLYSHTKLLWLGFAFAFLAWFPTPLPLIQRRPWIAGIGIAAAVAYALASLFWRGFVVTLPSLDMVYTPPERWVTAAYEWGIIGLVLFAVARLSGEKPGRGRQALAIVALGLSGFHFVYTSEAYAGFAIAPLLGEDPPWWRFGRGETLPEKIMWSTDQAWLLVLPLAAVVALRLPSPGDGERALQWGIFGCIALGALQSLLSYVTGERIILWALWVAASPIIVLIGILRVEEIGRARQMALAGASALCLLAVLYVGTAAAVVAIVGVEGIGGFVAQIAALAVVGVAAIPVVALARRGLAPETHTHSRNLAVYRAALRDVMDATPERAAEDATGLARLRAELGISERDHAVILHLLRDESAQRSVWDLAAGTDFLGRYAIERPLGQGGFGETWLAKDKKLGRFVAVKRVRSDALGRRARTLLLREMRALAAMRHPHIVALHDIQEVGEEVYLIMEYAEGGSLRQALAARGPFPPVELERHARELLGALAHVHAKGLVHGDVKLSNILLREGQALLADFGSVALRRAEVELTLSGLASMSSSPPGTLLYAAPEQIEGALPDARSDLYSLAATLTELATGRHYLGVIGAGDLETRRAIAARAPDLDGVTDARLRAWLATSLAKDPRDRFQDAERALEALPGPDRNRAAADR